LDGEYWCIDAWGKHGTMANETGRYTTGKHEMDSAQWRLAPFGKRVHIVRELSLTAARMHADATFDWIYVDAVHTYEGSLSDMRAWWPKLRPGGLFSGDDYADAGAAGLMTPARWKRAYPVRFGGFVMSRWGVARAAEHFAAEVGRQLMITWLKGDTGTTPAEGNLSCYAYPAWYMIK